MVKELEQQIHLVAKYRNSSLIHSLVDLEEEEEDRDLEWEWDHSKVGVDLAFLPNNNNNKWAELLDRWVEPEEVVLESERRQLNSLAVEDFNNSHSRVVLVALVDLSNNKWQLPLNKCSGEVNSQQGRG